jgi:hypothetical protein
VLGLVIQQAAYHAWRAELRGFWWPLVQFFALQSLIGGVVWRAIGCAFRSGIPGERRG